MPGSIPVQGIAAPTVDAFATPLGEIPLDHEALTSLADLPFVRPADPPHVPEHALEVELPFLQARLSEIAVAPLVIGDASPEQVATVLDRLWGGAETLIVISSDLSHFLPYAAAFARDATTAGRIE